MSLLKRLFRRRPERPIKVATAVTGYFPIGYLTFVYQEITGFRELMAADLTILYWLDGDESQLHSAFRPLMEHRKKLPFDRARHLEDRDELRARYPERWAALLERLASETGRAAEEVEDEEHFLQACTFTREVERDGIEYIHTYFFYEQSFYGLVASWLLDIPRGVSAYADHMMEDYPFKLVGLQVEKAAVVVATSKRIKSELIEKSSPAFADRIIVKPNGADGRRFKFGERPALGERLELLSICRIERKKGLLTLARAIRACKDRGQRVTVHMVGTADPGCAGSVDYAAEFEQLVDELDLRDAFEMHGYMKQDEIVPLMDRCHAFIAPYVETESGDKDGIPTAILEAMACGLPILCTDAGSILEVVRDGVEGFVGEQGDADSLVRSMDRLRAAAAELPKLGRNARQRFAEEFDYCVTEERLHKRVMAAVAARRKRSGAASP